MIQHLHDKIVKLNENVEYSMGVDMDEDKISAIQSLCDKVMQLNIL